MGRKIKFRAYDKTYKKMLYNVENTYDYGCKGDNEVQENRFADVLYNEQYDVMQYTDLKDWDEKEVYEGDIIQYLYDGYDENDQYIVEWDEENLQYSFKNTRKSDYMALEDMYDCDYGKYSIRVIGNIYENPELLKEE